MSLWVKTCDRVSYDSLLGIREAWTRSPKLANEYKHSVFLTSVFGGACALILETPRTRASRQEKVPTLNYWQLSLWMHQGEVIVWGLNWASNRTDWGMKWQRWKCARTQTRAHIQVHTHTSTRTHTSHTHTNVREKHPRTKQESQNRWQYRPFAGIARLLAKQLGLSFLHAQVHRNWVLSENIVTFKEEHRQPGPAFADVAVCDACLGPPALLQSYLKLAKITASAQSQSWKYGENGTEQSSTSLSSETERAWTPKQRMC